MATTSNLFSFTTAQCYRLLVQVFSVPISERGARNDRTQSFLEFNLLLRRHPGGKRRHKRSNGIVSCNKDRDKMSLPRHCFSACSNVISIEIVLTKFDLSYNFSKLDFMMTFIVKVESAIFFFLSIYRHNNYFLR